MSIAETIKNAREALGMTQEDLAEKLDVSRQAVSKWELGASVPTQENLTTLAEVLGVHFPEGEEEGAPPPARRKMPPWGIALLALAALMLAALLSIGLYRIRKSVPPKESSITGVYWFAEDGTALRPDIIGDGWYRFTPESRVLLAVSYQNGTETPVMGVAVYLTPTGTETYNEREQLAVHSVGEGNLALFALDIPQGMMDHMEIMLECAGGQVVSEMLNVTSDIP